MKSLLVLTAVLAMSVSCGAAIITVDDDGPADYDNIQAAIDNANDFDTVLVADGMYTGPGNRDLDFLGKAITVQSINPEDPCVVAATVIDSEGGWLDGHRGFIFWNGEDENSVLDGFSIINGLAWNEDGGGILCDGSSPTIRNCIIKNNSAEFHMFAGGTGGGIALYESGATIVNCTITSNSASFNGGGICIVSVASYPTIKKCTIADNEANDGGGIYCYGNNAVIKDCTITNNEAEIDGGGLYVGYGSNSLIENCIIRDSGDYSGGIHFVACTSTVRNCLISGCSGAGIDCADGGDPTISNCTIVDNTSKGGIYCYWSDPTMTNCILWGNTSTFYGSQISLRAGSSWPSTLTVSYCDVEGGQAQAYVENGCSLNWLSGNINANPLFVDAPSGDYHLPVDSPCIDVGDNSVVDPDDTDLDGNPRIVSGTVDMGAYEFQGIVYVDDDALLGGDGLSWETAYKYLQDALAVAKSCSEIRVAEGIYTPDANSMVPDGSGDRTATFQLKSGVTVKGGYAGFGETDPNARDVGAYETILSGDLSGDDVGDPEWPEDPSRNDNSYHVVTGSGTNATAVLDGFTVTAGNAPYAGGGMYNDMGSPTVTNCVFSANSAYYYGCGMDNSSSSPTVTNCSFSHNSGGGAGGGMCNTNSSPTVTNCTFSGNSAPGIFISEGGGGGIYNCGSSPTLTNCIFSGNSAGRGGGGMSNYYDSSPTLTNCTFNGNSALIGGGMENAHGSSPILTNCILWGNTPDEIFGGLPDVTYCDVEGGWPGDGNIDADPLFVDPNGPDGIVGTEDDNLRLLAGSPCIDAGDNSVVDPNDTDLDGNPRILNDTVDMGAYEFQGIIYVDDDAPNDPGPGDPNISDPLENGTEAHPFDEIQEGIDVAQDGFTIVVNPGQYLGHAPPWQAEEINFLGKNITLTSTDPTDPNMTVIRGAVQFDGTENSSCALRGFRICDLSFGAIYGNGTHATISHCIITGNGPCGATVLENCDGIISNCLITDNITIFLCGVYPVVFGCHGTIKNCTIANNASGVSVLDGAETTIENSIIYYNDESFTPQVSVGNGGTVNISYCNVQGGLGAVVGEGTVNWGPGNINADPCFAQLGYWQEDPFELVEGNYHLKSEGWRWRGFLAHGSPWTYDYVTSRCIDAANPGSPLLDEVMTALPDDPENEWGENLRRNMGAFGGTAEASMPPYGWALLADLTNDGVVNLVDFAWQAKDWLASKTEQPGDLNRDGIVDITDTAMVAEDWLEMTDWAQ